MKLFLNDASPYAKLVVVTALESGLHDIELIWSDPWKSPRELLEANPFSTVPTLLTDAGEPLCESTFICDYLTVVAKSPGAELQPVQRADAAAMNRYATGKNLIDNAFRRVIMARCLGNVGDNELASRAEAALVRALSRFESKDLPAPTRPDNADLCLAIAFDYLRFRLNDLYVAQSGPAAKRWMAWCDDRPSFQRCALPRLQARPTKIGEL